MRNPYFSILMIGVIIVADFLVYATVAAPKAEAYPHRYYRGGVYSPAGVDRRVARRTSRRVTRRHMVYGLPGGYRPFYWGGYNYYRAGGLYYYPYFYGGRTVYVQVDVDASGNPSPPPPSSEIDFSVSVH